MSEEPAHDRNRELYDRMLGAQPDVTALEETALEETALETELDAARAIERLEAVNAELMRRNADLEHIASVISHDFRAPLRSVRTFAEFIHEDFRREMPAQALTYVRRMSDAAARMDALIDGLLRFVRVSGTVPEREPVDVGEVVSDVLKDHASDLEAAGARVHVAPMPTVLGHDAELRSLLANLVSNAVKYRALPRPLELRFDATARGDSVEVSLTDNGLGFDPKLFEQARTIFVQLHPRGSFEGVGLGLALCQRILERHGSALTATSAPGRGSTFSFVLPLASLP